MKARPTKIAEHGSRVACAPGEATHLTFRMPGPTGLLTLPVITLGRREGTGCWTWNGDTEKPTIRPSILSRMGRDGAVVCHSWLNDGRVQFLDDCTHEFRGQTLDLLELEDAQ